MRRRFVLRSDAPWPIARDFIADRRGNMATMFALSFIPLVAVAGAAVDYGNALRVKAQLQNAVDTAALTGGNDKMNGKTDAEVQATVAAVMSARFTSSNVAISGLSTTIDATTSAVQVQATSTDRKSTRLNSSHIPLSRMPSSA